MDAPGPWLRLRTVPKPADPAPSLAQAGPLKRAWVTGIPGRCAHVCDLRNCKLAYVEVAKLASSCVDAFCDARHGATGALLA